MLVADLRILPIGEGPSMDDTLQAVVEALDDVGVSYEVGALATTIEAGSLDEVLEAVRVAHEAGIAGADRLVTELTIDHRTDKEETAASLREGVTPAQAS